MFPFFTVVEASLPPTLYPIHTWPLSTRQSLEKSLAACGLFCSMVPRNTPLLTSPPHLPEASSSFQVVQPFFMSPPLALLLRASSSLDPAQTLSLFYGTSLHVSKEAVAAGCGSYPGCYNVCNHFPPAKRQEWPSHPHTHQSPWCPTSKRMNCGLGLFVSSLSFCIFVEVSDYTTSKILASESSGFTVSSQEALGLVPSTSWGPL